MYPLLVLDDIVPAALCHASRSDQYNQVPFDCSAESQ